MAMVIPQWIKYINFYKMVKNKYLIPGIGLILYFWDAFTNKVNEFEFAVPILHIVFIDWIVELIQ
jgi:hypothetical protein